MNIDIKERIVRLLIFIIINYIIVRYALGLNLSDIDQTKIVLGSSVCFMFVNTMYPVVVTR
jgi:hypothetical protein